MQHGAAGAEGCLEFVGAERYLGRETDAHQYRNSNQTAAAGDGVYQTGNESGSEQEW
jgi:hypothetical protein